jgi:hypothetical protein
MISTARPDGRRCILSGIDYPNTLMLRRMCKCEFAFCVKLILQIHIC